MYYKIEFDVTQFPFWSGAYDRVKNLNCDQLQALNERIEEVFAGDEIIPTITEINDFVWFECDDFLNELKENK